MEHVASHSIEVLISRTGGCPFFCIPRIDLSVDQRIQHSHASIDLTVRQVLGV